MRDKRGRGETRSEEEIPFTFYKRRTKKEHHSKAHCDKASLHNTQLDGDSSCLLSP